MRFTKFMVDLHARYRMGEIDSY